MKKITVTLSYEAEKVFDDLMYSLPKEEDGTGMCTQSEAICYALQRMDHLEQQPEVSDGQIQDIVIAELDANAVSYRGATVLQSEVFERIAENIDENVSELIQSHHPQPISEERIDTMMKEEPHYIKKEYFTNDERKAYGLAIQAALKELTKTNE